MNTTLMNNITAKGKSILALAVLALATLAMVPMVQAIETEFDYAAQTLRVGVWIEDLDEGDVLEKGEELAVGIQTNEDSYAVVYRINTEGLVTVLWPRSRMDDGFVFGGHEYLMPVVGGSRLVAGSRAGEGFIEAIVSRYPFDLRDLALDFHHEYEDARHNFEVIGDPFLAINEINFAITGMEDSDDYVVTNYLSYYVHEQVEHPRYLCNQCHMDDDVAINPYTDTCVIDITVDHGWGNDLYDDVGFYPIYHNPVYVYYDPWTWRPWVNFWYDPFYTCYYPPHYTHHQASYVWCDSPYYRYDGVRVKSGRGLYEHPKNKYSGRRKTADYTGFSGTVSRHGPTDGEREAMRQKRRTPSDVSGSVRGGRPTRTNDAPRISGGVRPISRPRPEISTTVRGKSRGGLQIRPAGDRTLGKPGRARSGHNLTPVTNPVRGGISNGSGEGRSGGFLPVRGVPGNGSGGSTTVRGTSRTVPDRSQNVRPTRGADKDRKIKPVEPRKKGTRIWNSGAGSKSGDRKVRNPSRSSSGRKGSSSSTVRPRSNNSSSGSSNSGSSSQVKPKSSSRGSSGSSSGSSSKSRGSSSGSSGSSSSSSKSKSSSSKSGRDGGSSRSRR